MAQPAPSYAASCGELWCLQGSPWSLRVRWVLAICGATVDIKPYKPFVHQFALWCRLGFPMRGPPISVPVLFPTDKSLPPIRSSLDIARYLASKEGKNHQDKLFPPEYDHEIKRLVQCSDRFLEYRRAQMNKLMIARPEFAVNLFLPPQARGLFFAKPLMRCLMWLFSRKYPSCSQNDYLQSVEAIKAAVKSSRSGYLCGPSLTFADICVAIAVHMPTSRPMKKMPGAAELTQELAEVITWHDRIVADHFVGDIEQAFLFQT